MTFEEIYATRPDHKEIGSSGYSRMKHLYDICRRENPEIIIESGTWKGNSSYLFRKACPKATITCHDIDFSNLMWRDNSIFYIDRDLEEEGHRTDFMKPYYSKKNCLLFFDDHISQKQRIDWCIKNGYKKLIFDDNVSGKEADTLKNPASPTLQMINFKENYEHKEYEILPYHGKEIRDTYLTWIRL